MHAYTTDGWGDLTKILEVRGLVGRAGEAIVLLVAVLVVSTLVLVPDQARVALGSELLVTGLLAWSILVVIHVRAVRGRVGPSHTVLVGRVVMAQVASCRSWSPGSRCCCGPVAGSTGWFPGSSCAWWSRCSTRGCCSSRSCGEAKLGRATADRST
jgi:hypothetical protein